MLTVRQTFLASLDRSVVAANYAIIATELGALNLAPWIATAYAYDLMHSICIKSPTEPSMLGISSPYPLLKPCMED